MNEDPLRLAEMGDPPPELMALVRRMHGPPALPPDLSARMRSRAVRPGRPRLWIVGPTLALVTFAGGGYVAYRVVVVPPQVRQAPVATPPVERRDDEEIVVASVSPLDPEPSVEAAPEPVIAPASPAVEERPVVVPPRLPRPRGGHVEERRRAPLGPREAAPRRDARLIIQTIPWSRVFVDGRDTQRDTPIRELLVEPGRHRVGMRTEDGVMHTTEIDVAAGETMRIVRQLGPSRAGRASHPIRVADRSESVGVSPF